MERKKAKTTHNESIKLRHKNIFTRKLSGTMLVDTNMSTEMQKIYLYHPKQND